MPRVLLFAAVSVSLCLATGPVALAADANGVYAIRGAGTVSCGAYLNSSPQEKLYAQTWWAGYVTAMNRVTPKTYHLLGKASVEAVEKWLANYCRRNPKARFESAVNAMLKAAYPNRAQTAP